MLATILIISGLLAIATMLGVLLKNKHDPYEFSPNPGYQPVPDGTLIDVEYESGEISYGVGAGIDGSEGSIPGLFAVSWRQDPDLPCTIKSWRLHRSS